MPRPNTLIRVVAISGATVAFSYRSLPGNQPSKYGNFIAVWEDSVIPYSKPPLRKVDISNNNPAGSVAVPDLNPETNQYIFGYGVGPQISDICSYAYISPDESQTDFSSSLMLLSVQPDSIILRYSLPPGCNPAQNGASVAVWQDSIGSYTNPPLITQRITGSSSTGTIAIVGVRLDFGVVYTVALLTSNSQTSMTAWVTFDVGE